MKQEDVMKILDLLKSIENKHDTLKARHDMLYQMVTALQSRLSVLENRILPNYPIASPAYPPGYFPAQLRYTTSPYIQITPGFSVSPSLDANTYPYNCIVPVSSTKGP